MKLVRFGEAGAEKPGMIGSDGIIRDLSGLIRDIDGANIGAEGIARLRQVDPTSLPPAPPKARLGPCVGRVGKFVCIGLNYADHATESNLPIPDEPVVFLKATSAISGPNDAVIKPRDSTKLDWEVELGLVIGTAASYVNENDAMAHIAGYCVVNDVSERSFQLERGGTWDKGKGCDTFGPIGPWLVTHDEIADPENLNLWLSVNGTRHQNGSTATMIFKPAFLVSYLSRFMTLHPGDIIATGTPPGVGMGHKPEPIWLESGDIMELGITGLGVQEQQVRTAQTVLVPVSTD